MLQPQPTSDVPEMTKILARTAFPKGSVVMTMRDHLGPIFEDEMFADLYPQLGQPAESPGRLALVTVMQFMENLTDRQAADAVYYRFKLDYGKPPLVFGYNSEVEGTGHSINKARGAALYSKHDVLLSLLAEFFGKGGASGELLVNVQLEETPGPLSGLLRRFKGTGDSMRGDAGPQQLLTKPSGWTASRGIDDN